MKRKKSAFGAVTDDPVSLADRAIREAERAVKAKDDVGFREAAEKAWLAISSAADVAADKMNRPIPGGAAGRRSSLEVLETKARLRRGTLVGTFEAARTTLHGECFHGASCSTAGVLGLIDDVRETVEDVDKALDKVTKKKRR